MATQFAPNTSIAFQPAAKSTIPGEQVVTQTTVTQTTQYASAPIMSKGFAIFESVFGVIAGFGMFCGAALILTAMALVLRDVNFYYTTIGGLLIAGFSLWFLAALFNWVPNFGGFSKKSGPGNTRSGYHIFNIFANAMAWVGFAVLIAGAGCFLSSFGEPRYAGEILWIIGSGIWLLSMLLRDLGLRYDAMNTYKNYAPTTVNYPNAKKGIGAHLSSVWSNAFATDLYLVAATLLTVGAIFWAVRGRSFDRDVNTANTFQTAAAILWIVSAGIVLFAAIAHCIARR